jgi:hypothetical protein
MTERPIEPCNDFEHPIRWAKLAYLEKARADRIEAENKCLQEEVIQLKKRIFEYRLKDELYLINILGSQGRALMDKE